MASAIIPCSSCAAAHESQDKNDISPSQIAAHCTQHNNRSNNALKRSEAEQVLLCALLAIFIHKAASALPVLALKTAHACLSCSQKKKAAKVVYMIHSSSIVTCLLVRSKQILLQAARAAPADRQGPAASDQLLPAPPPMACSTEDAVKHSSHQEQPIHSAMAALVCQLLMLTVRQTMPRCTLQSCWPYYQNLYCIHEMMFA